MSYSFDLMGVAPILTFFEYQQQAEQSPQRGKAYLGSYACTLDSFIQSTQMVPHQPNWDWEAVVKEIVNFWLQHEDKVQACKQELVSSPEETIVVAKVVNFEAMRHEFESLFAL
jgi:hypothetical protein